VVAEFKMMDGTMHLFIYPDFLILKTKRKLSTTGSEQHRSSVISIHEDFHIGTNFADKWQSLGQYSSLVD
jgi:hypothetical protein